MIVLMAKKSCNTDITHLAAYAEDPRSYCYYRGVPRSLHKKETRKKKLPWHPLRTPLGNALLLVSVLFLLVTGGCLWILLG